MTDGLMSWQPRNTDSSAQPRVTQSASCYPNSMMRPWSLYHQSVKPATDLIDHHVVGTDRQLKLNTSLHHPAVKAERQRLQDTLMTYDKTWTIEPVRPDRYMDQGAMLQHGKMAIRPSATSITFPGPITAAGLHQNCS